MRVKVPRENDVTHTAPPPTAIPFALAPTEGVVAITRSVSESIRVTVPVTESVTQTAPCPIVGSGVNVGSMVGPCCVSDGIVVSVAEIVDMVCIVGAGVAGSDVCGNGLQLTAKSSNPESRV